MSLLGTEIKPITLLSCIIPVPGKRIMSDSKHQLAAPYSRELVGCQTEVPPLLPQTEGVAATRHHRL
jgi:hypothetical protein